MGVPREIAPNYGPSGRGAIRFNKTSVKVVAESGDVYLFEYDDLAQEIVQKNQKDIYYSLTVDEEGLTAVRPWSDNHVGTFIGFTHESEDGDDNGVPRINDIKGGKRERIHPVSKKKQTWTEPDRRKFTAVLQITSGDFKDYTMLMGMDYPFVPYKSGLAKMYLPRQTWMDKVENFLYLTGYDLDDEDIPWSDNVLEYLEPILLDRAGRHKFLINVETGWPSISRIPTGVTAV